MRLDATFQYRTELTVFFLLFVTSVKSPILVNRELVPSNWKEESLESTENDNELKKANKLLSSQQNPLSKFFYKLNKPVITEVG